MQGLNSNENFKRVEIKYLIDKKTYLLFFSEITRYMKIDQYGIDTISNVYYDTENFDLVRRSIEKPVYKEKLRIRSYGVADEDGKSFVEIKKKYEGIVYKRRIELALSDTKRYVNQRIQPQKHTQIQKEISYFLNFYKPIPAMYVAYERMALYGMENPNLRLTFDFQIRARDYDLDLVKGDYGNLLLDENQVLMEIKVPGAYPLWLSGLLDKLHIYPVSFSKYGTAYLKKCHGEIKLSPFIETGKPKE